MKGPTGPQLSQRLRWERLQITIRCGLQADQPALIRTWLGLGQWLVRHGALHEPQTSQHTLQVLLDSASDEALPWYWRSVCLEHLDRPLARLAMASGPLDQARWHRLQALADLLRDGLPLAPARTGASDTP